MTRTRTLSLFYPPLAEQLMHVCLIFFLPKVLLPTRSQFLLVFLKNRLGWMV